VVDVRSSTKTRGGQLCRWLLFFGLHVICRIFYHEYAEYKCLAKLLKLPVGELFIGNILYEVFGGCTTFVCSERNRRSGREKAKPVMGSTLDWPFLSLAKYTVHFEWERDGKVAFHSVGWFGAVGVMTGVKAGCFIVALNARYPDFEPSPWVSKALQFFVKDEDQHAELLTFATNAIPKVQSVLHLNAWSCTSLIRQVLEDPTVSSFDAAVTVLTSKRLLVPCYFNVVGCLPDHVAEKGSRRTHEDDSVLLHNATTRPGGPHGGRVGQQGRRARLSGERWLLFE
jgi:hypothetical protein